GNEQEGKEAVGGKDLGSDPPGLQRPDFQRMILDPTDNVFDRRRRARCIGRDVGIERNFIPARHSLYFHVRAKDRLATDDEQALIDVRLERNLLLGAGNEAIDFRAAGVVNELSKRAQGTLGTNGLLAVSRQRPSASGAGLLPLPEHRGPSSYR